jgi:hypothetical protein
MLKFSVSKDLKKEGYKKGGGSREVSGTFMFNTNFQEIELMLSRVGW